MIRASVIGWPIGHSRSPLIHNYWLRKYQISGDYDKQAVSPEALKTFIDGLRSGQRVGTNVTLPHKESAVAHVDEPDDRVRRIGALNTIWRDGTKLRATSTDGPGFMASLKASAPDFHAANLPVTILGAGGSTRALIDELMRQGVNRINLHNRTMSRAEALANHFGPAVHVVDAASLGPSLANTGLLINTTSAGLNGEDQMPLPWDQLNPGATVADIVYTPLITPFLQTARARDHVIVPGLGMLLHQAVVGFEKWFGVRPEVTQELHDLVAKDIDPDYSP
jgi:shikimate dehydrogenase